MASNSNQKTVFNPKTKRTIMNWIGERIRLELVDGRVIIGRFVCTDNTPNLVLTESEEFWKDREKNAAQNSKLLTKRFVGMVMVPGRHIKKIINFPKVAKFV